MSKKTIYILGWSSSTYCRLIISKSGVIGIKRRKGPIEIAQVNPITIVETVSATGKIQPEIEVKFHLRFQEIISLM
jgi:HlyD family secretion protein